MFLKRELPWWNSLHITIDNSNNLNLFTETKKELTLKQILPVVAYNT